MSTNSPTDAEKRDITQAQVNLDLARSRMTLVEVNFEMAVDDDWRKHHSPDEVSFVGESIEKFKPIMNMMCEQIMKLPPANALAASADLLAFVEDIRILSSHGHFDTPLVT